MDRMTYADYLVKAESMGVSVETLIRQRVNELINGLNSDDLHIIRYRKLSDVYERLYITIGSNPVLRINSNGDEFLRIDTVKGNTGYSIFSLFKCKNVDILVDKIIELMKEDYSMKLY